jgi:hypothetical protein
MLLPRGFWIVNRRVAAPVVPTKVAGKASSGKGDNTGSASAAPSPDSATVVAGGTLLASDKMVNKAVRAPTVVGAKLSVTPQLAATAKGAPAAQVPLRVNSVPALPVMLNALMVKGAAPMLRTVKLCCAPLPMATVPKGRAVTPPKSMAGCGPAVAMPFRLTLLGLPTALCVMLKLAGRLPAAAGAKRSARVQLPAAATVPPAAQVLEGAKLYSPAKPPPRVNAVKLSGALPVLLMVVLAVLGVPTTAEKAKALLPRLNTGAATVAVPDRPTLVGRGATAPPVNVKPRLPLRAPAPAAACGVNCSVSVQLPPEGTLRVAHDSLVMPKSKELVPEIAVL